MAARIYDPFEYLMLRHKTGQLKTNFKTSLGRVSYHVCLPSAGAEHRTEKPAICCGWCPTQP